TSVIQHPSPEAATIGDVFVLVIRKRSSRAMIFWAFGPGIGVFSTTPRFGLPDDGTAEGGTWEGVLSLMVSWDRGQREGKKSTVPQFDLPPSLGPSAFMPRSRVAPSKWPRRTKRLPDRSTKRSTRSK